MGRILVFSPLNLFAMYPINQVILGNDSMFNNIEDLDSQIKRIELYRQKLKQFNEIKTNSVWNEIDNEISTLTEEQRLRMQQDSEYMSIYNELQLMVQSELLNLVKDKIEGSAKGKDLLEKQLTLVKKLKSKIVEDTETEMKLFNKFKEYSKSNPNITYEQFIKDNI